MNQIKVDLCFAATLVLLVAGCGDDTGGVDSGTDGSTDVSGDSIIEDGSNDATVDVGVDAGPPCSFPEVRIAGTPETDALRDAPARCGAPAYSWISDASLGTVTQRSEGRILDLTIIIALINAQGVSLDPEPTHPVAIQQYAYMTQDRGELVEATSLVAYPLDVEEDPPVILFQHGTTGFTDGCGVSEDAGYQSIAALLAGYGYLVVMPDYIGLGHLDTRTEDPHAYLVGEPAAIGSLDAVRAAARLERGERGGTCMAPRFAIFGVSQGGHAALFTERLAPYYAPELELVGTVATVPPAALVAEAELNFSTLASGTGNIAAAIATMSSWYGQSDTLNEVFVAPWDMSLPELLTSGCELPAESALPETLEELLQPDIRTRAGDGTLAELDPWGCMFRENDVRSTSVPRLDAYPENYGILMITGEMDELVNTPAEREAYSSICSGGLPVQYLECEGAGHVDASFYSIPEMLDFVEQRFSGAAFESTCTTPVARCRATPDE